MRLDGKITSFRVLSPVPEPTTYAMLGLGLGVMGLIRRNRQAKRTATAPAKRIDLQSACDHWG